MDVLTKGKEAFEDICFTCHGDDARGAPVPSRPGAMKAPPLAGAQRVNGHRDYVMVPNGNKAVADKLFSILFHKEKD
jgi:cytochrome c